jgi:transposase
VEVFVKVQSDVRLEYVDRMEVLAGPTGRRIWPDKVKGLLVAESFVPGVSVREVAERNALQPNRLSTWRSLAKQGKLVVPELAGADFGSDIAPTTKALDFANVVLDDAAPLVSCQDHIELETGGVKLRLDANTGARRITELATALKAVL